MIKRKTKIITIVALVIAIVGMSLGFAAFSATLNISSSATVNPNSEDFKIKLTGINGDNKLAVVETNITGEIEDGIISDDGQSISGINVPFTKPGDYVIYEAYIDNVGEYDAYFYGIEVEMIEGVNAVKKCTPIDDVNMDLLNAVCPNIGFQHYFESDDGTLAYKNGVLNEDYILKKGTRHTMLIRYMYLANAEYVDGSFNVEFGDTSLSYGTTPKNS